METETATAEKSPLYSYLELHKATDPSEFIRSHEAAVDYHAEFQDAREMYHNFVGGDPWDDEEKAVLADKKKKAISISKLKPSQRAFIGSIIQQRYDMKPAPMDETDQDASDAISTLYHWTGHSCQTIHKDPSLVNEAWIGGNAWQESIVETGPGQKPVIRVYNMNPFSVYPDPDSRDLVDRRDCRFIDRVLWLPLATICQRFPQHAKELKEALSDFTNSGTFDKDKKRRAHEAKNYRNGNFKVVERLYRVCKAYHFGTLEGNRVEIGWDPDPETLAAFQEDYPEHQVARQRQEFFYIATVCPAWSGKFLINEEYEDQPKDPVTGELMWPWVELIDEELDGIPQGHVAHQIGPIQVINSMVVNKVHQAKHAAGQVHILSPDHFDEETIDDVAENIANGSRSVIKKKNAPPGSGVELAPLAQMGKDGNEMIDWASSFAEEVSSTPPAMRGVAEGSSTPASLNEQRIQQSHVQSSWAVNNYRLFLTKRTKLWVYYIQKHYTFPMKVRILEKKNPKDPDFMGVNQLVRDPILGLRKLNDVSVLQYDIVFEDSWQSPTTREKVRKEILEWRKAGGTATDPALDGAIMQFFFKLSDAPQELKDFVREHSTALQQQHARQQQAEAQGSDLETAERLQAFADREAAATSPNLQPAAVAA